MLGIKATNSLYKSNPQSTKEMYVPLYFDIDINACFNAGTEGSLLHSIIYSRSPSSDEHIKKNLN